MPPTPPSDSSTGKKASNPIAPRSRSLRAGSIARGSTPASTSSLNLKTSNNVHTRSGSSGIRKPAATAMGPPAGKNPLNKKFDSIFYKSPVPRAISKLISNSQFTSSANNNNCPPVPSSLRRSIGAGPSTSASATTSTTTDTNLKKTRGVIAKKPTTTTPASTRQTPKPTKPTAATTTSGANGAVLADFTLPNDGHEQALPTPTGEPSDDDGGGEDLIPARAATGPTPKPRARASLRSSVIPGTPKLPIATRSSMRGTNGNHVKRTKQAQKVVDSPKGVMRNTASSRARAAANSGAGAKNGIKAGEMQVGRMSTASVGTTAVAMTMPTTPVAPPPTSRETRSSGLSSRFKSRARGHINAWAEAQKKGPPKPEPAKENQKEEIILPTLEVHIPIPARPSTTKEHNPPSPTASPPKPKSTRKPHPSTLTPGFVIPPGILDETGSLWDSGRRKSRRSIGTPTSTTTPAPITNTRRRRTIAGGSTSAVNVNINGNGKRKSMSDADVGSVRKKARVSNTEVVEMPNGGTGGSEKGSKPASAKGREGGKGKEKVYVNTDFEFSDIEV